MNSRTITEASLRSHTGKPINPAVITSELLDALRNQQRGRDPTARHRFLLWLAGREPQRSIDVESCNLWLERPVCGVYVWIHTHTDGSHRLWEVTKGEQHHPFGIRKYSDFELNYIA